MRKYGKEMKEIWSVTSNIHSSTEVTKSTVTQKTYGSNFIQFRILNGSCPFSSHFHIIISYLSLIPGGKMSPLITFHVFIYHKMAIMQLQFPFLSWLSEKLRTVFVAPVLQCIQFRYQKFISPISFLR